MLAIRLEAVNDGAGVAITLAEIDVPNVDDAASDALTLIIKGPGLGDVTRNADGTMKPALDIAAFWAEQGVHPGLALAFYCGTGWRASLAFYYAWLMGWERISVYDGGWFEWSGG